MNKTFTRIITTITATIAVLTLTGTAAHADLGTPGLTNNVAKIAQHAKPCVATVWRAHHTHKRMTRPGEACIWKQNGPDVAYWIPSSWVLLGCGATESYDYCVVRRPVVGR